MNGGTIGIGLLQQRLVQGIRHLTLRFQHFRSRNALLGLVHIDNIPTPVATTQAHLAIGVSHEIGLCNLALYAFRQLARNLHDIGAVFLNRLWNLQHIGNLLQHTAQLGVKVVVVVDDAQMRMSLPGTVHLLVQVARQLQSFFVGLLIAVGIGGNGIILFCTISSRHQMQHGIIALAQLIAARTTLAGNVLPHLWGDIGRNVHRTAVAHHEGGFGTGFRQTHKRILQRQLRLQDG